MAESVVVEPVAMQAQYGADVSKAKHLPATVTKMRGAAKAYRTGNRTMDASASASSLVSLA
ncbi:hypothetical protein [Frondihabitans sp. PhB188]|uniref:hypothetical protein n=1 Tax=Frondihabitans sp. PhB188 TaxID=2485200 RepID=UPI0011CEB08E|nr:hypothetical protein [Frondihabitans sp. PhB188]